MPFYTFKCPNCDVVKEILQKMDDPNPKCEDCLECGCNRADGTCGCDGKMKSHIMEKLISIPSKPQFKGSGFYETDYKPTIGVGGVKGYSTPEAAMKAAKGKK